MKIHKSDKELPIGSLSLHEYVNWYPRNISEEVLGISGTKCIQIFIRTPWQKFHFIQNKTKELKQWLTWLLLISMTSDVNDPIASSHLLVFFTASKENNLKGWWDFQSRVQYRATIHAEISKHHITSPWHNIISNAKPCMLKTAKLIIQVNEQITPHNEGLLLWVNECKGKTHQVLMLWNQRSHV